MNGTRTFFSTKQLVFRHDYTNHDDYDKFVYRCEAENRKSMLA